MITTKKTTHLTIKPVDISVRSVIHGNRCIRLYWKITIETQQNQLYKEPLSNLQSSLLYATTQNAKTELSLTGGDRLQESNHRGSPPIRGPGTSTL